MHVMLLGAGGFIGRHILVALLAAGHDVTAVVRKPRHLAAAFPKVRFLALDLAGATDVDGWRSRLVGIECIVNAAGKLRGAEMEAVHVRMPGALYAAAKQVAVKHILLISAISASPDADTDYADTKLTGEDLLRSSGVAWTILRPSLVYGNGSYGGTSLLRGLASLPWLVPLPGKGDSAFTPIHADDLARSVALICGNDSFFGRTLEPVGPETLDLRTLLARYRAWLGFGPARFLALPMPVMHFLGRVGDIVGDGPISTNSLKQVIAGNAGNSQDYADAIGFAPRSLDDALRTRPAEVQDRWHARLFFLAPVIRAVLILLWLVSAWVGFFHGAAATHALTQALGMPPDWDDPLRLSGSVIDIGVALLVFLDRDARWSTAVQAAVVAGYTLVIGIALPQLWLDPLGPLIKNIPTLLLIAIHGVIGNNR
ncbi:SDR family oxidoreductase [Sphingopyxis terrae]|uniref:SDR family oxidoreductase n=1 Tax=Sphingopyxis terrae TaxID=33052 RepID=UPI002A0D8CA6|nr:SDR family oxidoreductase [Sphingopyxis terrae]MDX8358111.1 SDR family oxidoreductase [Sphingopyxis terrae]